MQVKAEGSVVAMIGDLVHSRETGDRQRLHDEVTAVLRQINDVVPAEDGAIITVGDEFQAVYATLGNAIRASLEIRLRLPGEVRFGLGRGDVVTLDPERRIQDGSAYWAARRAIVETEERAGHAPTRSARTGFQTSSHDERDLREAGLVQATLNCLDLMIGSMAPPARTILGGLMHGQTQQSLADTLAVTPSAVSQRVRRDGIGVAVQTIETLAALP